MHEALRLTGVDDKMPLPPPPHPPTLRWMLLLLPPRPPSVPTADGSGEISFDEFVNALLFLSICLTVLQEFRAWMQM